MEKVVKFFKGREPGTGWSWITEFEFDGVVWSIFTCDEYKDEGRRLRRMKVVADGKAAHKANYELYLSEKTWRVTSNGLGLKRMEQWRPGMSTAILNALTEKIGIAVGVKSNNAVMLRKMMDKWKVNPWEKEKIELLEEMIKDEKERKKIKRLMVMKNKKAKSNGKGFA